MTQHDTATSRTFLKVTLQFLFGEFGTESTFDLQTVILLYSHHLSV